MFAYLEVVASICSVSGCVPLIIKLTDIQLEITGLHFFPSFKNCAVMFYNVNNIMSVFHTMPD